MPEKAEKRIHAVNKIKRISLKVTNHHDWVDQSGKPYLQASGGEKVARLFGISWRIDEPILENYEDGHFGYTYKGYFTWGGVTIEAIGTRSSKDGFFKKYDYSSKDAQGKAIKITLPASEIDKGDVKKSAYTNCIGNGITRLLGIRNLTYADLQEAGIDVSKITKVEYKQEEMSKEGKDIKVESHRMMTEMYGVDYSKQLEKLTSFTATGGKEVAGKKTLAGLSEKALPVIHGKIKELYGKHLKKGADAKTEQTAYPKDCKNPSLKEGCEGVTTDGLCKDDKYCKEG